MRYVFGPFSLDPLSRTLTLDGRQIRLPPRAFDVLQCLLENPGRTVDRAELARAAWGGRVVEDGAVRQTVYALRKALEIGGRGEFITTIPMRGHRLSVAVERVSAAEPASASDLAARRPFWARWRLWLLAAALTPAAAFTLLLWTGPRPVTAPPKNSVAVLPFTGAGHDASAEEFADGVSAELINTLSRVGGLHVSARTSSFLFRDRPASVREVARRLNVGAVLEGSVAHDGMRVRIVAGLVDAGTGFTVWSHSYDVDRRDLFDAQASIAEAVAASLQGLLGNGRTHDLALGGTHNSAAYEAYLHGLKNARIADSRNATEAALEAFETAIALDPHFAVARAWRARELAALYDESDRATQAERAQLMHEAAEEANRALAITPELGTAHLARADIAHEQQDFLQAEREMALAREYAPNDMEVLIDDVYLEAEFRHPAAALKAAELGVSLDPLAASAYAALSYAQLGVGAFDPASDSLRHARLLGPDTSENALIEAIIAFQRGDDRKAAEGCAHGPAGWVGELCLAIAEYRLGHANEAAAHLAALRGALGSNGAFQYAEVYAQWRQPADALKWLGVAYHTHDPGLAMLKSDTFLEPIRQTPQYAAIEEGLKFPP